MQEGERERRSVGRPRGKAIFETDLEQRVTSNNLQKPLQSLTASFDDLVGEPVAGIHSDQLHALGLSSAHGDSPPTEDLSGQLRDVDASRFPLEDITEGFEIRVATADRGVANAEGRDVGLRRGWRLARAARDGKAGARTRHMIS